MIAAAVLALTLVFAAVTWITAWWGVIVVALLAGALWRRHHAAAWCALGAALGWAVLLVMDASGGRLVKLAQVVGGVMRVPAAALALLTLLFAAAMAWSAAVIGGELSRRAGLALPKGSERMPRV